MAFEIPKDERSSVVELNVGTVRKPRNEEIKNEVGIGLQLDLDSGVVNGKVVLHDLKTGLKSRAELSHAIETFVNDLLKAKL